MQSYEDPVRETARSRIRTKCVCQDWALVLPQLHEAPPLEYVDSCSSSWFTQYFESFESAQQIRLKAKSRPFALPLVDDGREAGEDTRSSDLVSVFIADGCNDILEAKS